MNEGREFGGVLILDHAGGLANPRHISGDEPTTLENWLGQLLIGFARRHVCIGARSVSGKADVASATAGPMYFGVYPDMASVGAAMMFLDDLEQYYALSDPQDDIVKTFVAVFPASEVTSQTDFALQYWRFAQHLVDISAQTFPWDLTCSSDPTAQNFELSLAGRAVFTTTLNPHSPRTARRFTYPAWVMNQTQQFNSLRAKGDFQKWQTRIRAADAKLDPSRQSNPILTDHGYSSAAAQLPGSDVSPCPLRVPQSPEEIRVAGQRLLQLARQEQLRGAALVELKSRVDQP